jgi:hypothetical protein
MAWAQTFPQYYFGFPACREWYIYLCTEYIFPKPKGLGLWAIIKLFSLAYIISVVPNKQGSVHPVREGSQLSRIHLGFVNEVDMHSNRTLRFVSQETLCSLAHSTWFGPTF